VPGNGKPASESLAAGGGRERHGVRPRLRMSGFGQELGREVLDAYLQTKTVWIDLP
jgi:acyl-CoA reductase-like NAD-dependent aldehyde dehydrogenase